MQHIMAWQQHGSISAYQAATAIKQHLNGAALLLPAPHSLPLSSVMAAAGAESHGMAYQ